MAAMVNNPDTSAAVDTTETVIHNSLYSAPQLRDLSIWSVAVGDKNVSSGVGTEIEEGRDGRVSCGRGG